MPEKKATILEVLLFFVVVFCLFLWLWLTKIIFGHYHRWATAELSLNSVWLVIINKYSLSLFQTSTVSRLAVPTYLPILIFIWYVAGPRIIVQHWGCLLRFILILRCIIIQNLHAQSEEVSLCASWWSATETKTQYAGLVSYRREICKDEKSRLSELTSRSGPQIPCETL